MQSYNIVCSKFTKLLCILAVLFTAATVHAQDNVSARRPFGQHTVAFTATPTFDAGTTENWKMTITGNVTSSTLIGAEAGMFLKWEICQDNVGSHTFVWPSQLQNPLAIVATANTCTTEIFYYDGTNGFVPVTTTSGGGGSGTVNAGTVGQIAQYSAATTVSSDSKLDDGNTNANGLTYSGTAGIFASTYSATGTGAMTLSGKEGTCSGAAATFDIICVGDSTSHSIETSLNGGGFFPTVQHQSTSPTPHGIMLAETFPQIFAAPRGQPGQAFCEGLTAADPGYCSLNLAGGASIVQNILPKLNHPTSTVFGDQVNTFTSAGTLDLSASTVASSFRVENKTGITVALNGGLGYDTTSNNFHAGMNSADSIIPVTTVTPVNNNCPKWVVVSGNIQLGDTGSACGAGGGAPALSSIVNATTANSISNGDNAQTWQWTPSTAGRVSFRLSEPAAGTATGTPIGFQVDTFSGSTTNPAQFCAQGTSNCWRVDTSAVLKPVGTASLAAPGSNGQLLFNNAGTVAAEDPVVSQAFVNLWTAQDITVTRTSANVRNPIFSQSATLQLTFAGITGSPSGCTLQFRGVDSQGNVLNNGSTVSISPANGTSSQTFTAASTLQTAAQVSAVYACSTYPTAGTLTLDFTPIPNVLVTNTVTDNVAQFGGNAVVTGTGASGSGIPRVTISNDSSLAANQSVNVNQIGGSGVVADPCQQLARSSANINLTASGRIIVGTSAKQTYICSMDLISATAQNIALVEGTVTTCGTGTTGMAGGSTAATGWNLAANGGLVKGTGSNWVFKTATAADDVCLLLSSTGQTSGSVQYVQQ